MLWKRNIEGRKLVRLGLGGRVRVCFFVGRASLQWWQQSDYWEGSPTKSFLLLWPSTYLRILTE